MAWKSFLDFFSLLRSVKERSTEYFCRVKSIPIKITENFSQQMGISFLWPLTLEIYWSLLPWSIEPFLPAVFPPHWTVSSMVQCWPSTFCYQFSSLRYFCHYLSKLLKTLGQAFVFDQYTFYSTMPIAQTIGAWQCFSHSGPSPGLSLLILMFICHFYFECTYIIPYSMTDLNMY